MKKITGKIAGWHFSEKWVAILSCLCLVLLLIPLLRLSMYTVPWYDDYSYGRFVKSFVLEEGILKGAIDGAFYTVKTWWYCWQGTFSSIFMMTLVPEAFGDGLYYLGIIFIILFFTMSALVFVRMMAKHLLKANGAVQITLGVLITGTMLELIYTAQQGLFWYNSAVHYTFMHGVLFLLISAIIGLYFCKSAFGTCLLTVGAACLAVVCSGSNFVTALQGILIVAATMIITMIMKKKRSLFLVPVLLVYSIGLYYSISAPGNKVRGAYYTGYGAIESVLYSFKSAFMEFWNFTGMVTIVILCLYIVIIWNTLKRLNYSFAWPGLVTLFSFCFYATGFTSSYYGMGTAGVSRTWVVIKFTLQILLFINAGYWTGWWIHRRMKKQKKVPDVKQWVWVYFIAGAGIVFCFLFSNNRVGEYSSYGAYHYVHSGEAANFYAEYRTRIEQIESGGPVVEVEPYAWHPWFLCKDDLSTNPQEEKNRAMAEWYRKEAIYIKAE